MIDSEDVALELGQTLLDMASQLASEHDVDPDDVLVTVHLRHRVAGGCNVVTMGYLP